MEPKFKFEKLNIWKKAKSFGEEMNELAKKFPEIEKFNLSSQIRRAADSIALNIAEGSILQSVPQFRKFMGYSIRSLAEVVTCLYKAGNRKYITQNQFDNYYSDAFKLMNMMIAFRKKLI